jgi:hypothetical protein
MSCRIFPNPAQQHLLKTVRLELIEPGEFAQWNELIEQHHYLHNSVLVGEVLRYVARDYEGCWVALLGYSSASLRLPLHCRQRAQMTQKGKDHYA